MHFRIFNLKVELPLIVPRHNVILVSPMRIRKQHSFNYQLHIHYVTIISFSKNGLKYLKHLHQKLLKHELVRKLYRGFEASVANW